MAVTINGSTGISKVQDGVIVAADIVADSISASELNISGNGTSGQHLISDGDGSFSWNSLADLRDGITHVGLDAGDYIGWTNNLHQSFFINGNEEMRIEADGDLHADGDVIAYSTTISDERLKTGIMPITDALSKVNQLNGCTFTYMADGKKSAGLIAQDVEKVLPSAVSEKELPLKIDDGEKYKVLQYDQTIGLLVEAIKELSAKVEELENK